MSMVGRKFFLLQPVTHIGDKYLSHVFNFIITFYFVCAMVDDLVIQLFMFVCKYLYVGWMRVIDYLSELLCVVLLFFFIFSSSETMNVAPRY